MSSLSGWTLAAVIVAAIIVGGILILVLIVREGRSRKVRVGVFVEREYEDWPDGEDGPELPRSEWPTQH